MIQNRMHQPGQSRELILLSNWFSGWEDCFLKTGWILLLFLFPFSGHAISADNTTGWKAAVAKVNITPQPGLWLGGYAFRDHPSEGKITDLWAKAMALEDAAGNRSLIVTLDLVSIKKEVSDRIKARLHQEPGLEKSQVIINASHTHTSPAVSSFDIYKVPPQDLPMYRQKRDTYLKEIEDKIVLMVLKAFRKLKPAELYSGNGTARFQVNRHTNTEARLASSTHLNGPNDYAVPMIKVTNARGKIIGILFGYACHNTTLQEYKYSGDYAGFAQMELEKKYRGAVALFFQGAGGDQNPFPRSKISLARKYGKELAIAVSAVIEEDMKPLESRLSANYAEISLPYEYEPPTKEELEAIIDGTSAKNYADYLKGRARRLLDSLNVNGFLPSSYDHYPVLVWDVGGQLIVALGGELTVGYTLRLKEIFGPDIFVMGYSNNIMSYIPTAEMLGQGGYEVIMSPVFTTPFSPAIEGIIIRAARNLASEIGVSPVAAGK